MPERAAQQFMYFQLRDLPSEIHWIASLSRRSRVSSALASEIHSMYSRCLLGANSSKCARALALPASAFFSAGCIVIGFFLAVLLRTALTPSSLSFIAFFIRRANSVFFGS